MRRCVDDLHPDPAFPGCIYSEMKMCLAPCFKGCSDDDYRAEVKRVQAYLDSGGQCRSSANFRTSATMPPTTLTSKTRPPCTRASRNCNRLLAQLPEIVRRIDRLAGVMVQRSSAENCVALFRIDGGCIAGPATFPSSRLSTRSRNPWNHASNMRFGRDYSSAIGQRLANHGASCHSSVAGSIEAPGPEKFSSPTTKDTLPMRRIVRGIARVYRGEKPERFCHGGGAIPETSDLQCRRGPHEDQS